MTKKELCKKNRQAALDRLHSTEQWKESERLEEEHERLYKEGRKDEANKLYWKIHRLRKEARELVGNAGA